MNRIAIKNLIACGFAALATLVALADTWTDPDTGYTWTYRIDGNGAEIYNNGVAAVAPLPTGDVIIPSAIGELAVTKIGENAFRGNPSLSRVTIPGSVTNIGSYAFYGCTNLESVVFNEGLVSLSSGAFAMCTKLASVELPSTLIELGPKEARVSEVARENIFHYGELESYIGLRNGSSALLEVDWMLVASRFGATVVTNIEGSTTSETIAWSHCEDFAGNDATAGVGGFSVTHSSEIVKSEKYIPRADGTFAFETSTVTNNTVVGRFYYNDYGRGVFEGCRNLMSVKLQQGLKRIGAGVFKDCTSLRSIAIPNTVSFIGGHSDITLNDIIVRPEQRTKYTMNPDSTITTTIFLAFVETRPDSLNGTTTRACGFLQGCTNLVDVVLPCSLQYLGPFSFAGCASLAVAEVPSSVTNLGAEVFKDCASLESVSLSRRLTALSDGAFAGCSALEEVIVPESVTSVGNGVFSGCTQLQAVRFVGNAPACTAEAYDGASASLITYAAKRSRGWDGIPTSMSLPQFWPEGAEYEIRSWDPVRFTVSFDMNDGMSPAIGVEQVVGTTFMLPPDVDEVVGKFCGWWTAADGGSRLTELARVVQGQSHTAYAHWVFNTYCVRFDANGGQGEMADQPMTVASRTNLLECAYSRFAYTFVGWAVEPDGEVVYSDADEVVNLASGKDDVVTLYARWSANQYMVTFDAVDDVKTVTFDAEYGELPAATRTGYTFNGWKLDDELVTSDMVVKTANDHTLVAQWTANEYTVTFDANGGSVSGPSVTVTYGAAYGELPTATWTGHSFAGWWTAAEGGIQVAVEDIVNVAADHTLYAHWNISLGDPYCFVDPNATGNDGYANLCNGANWIDCWMDGEDWAVVPINGAGVEYELTPIIVYGSADASMISNIHIEDEATFKARIESAQYMEWEVETTNLTNPDDIRNFVASRKWLMAKINYKSGRFEPKTFFVGLKGGNEYRKFVIVCEDSEGAVEDDYNEYGETIVLPLPVGSATVSNNGAGARTVTVTPNAGMKVFGWSDDGSNTSAARSLQPSKAPYFVTMASNPTASARTVTLMANPNGELWPGIDACFDGGELAKAVVVGYGQQYPEFPVPVSSGYVVSGWYDSTDGSYIPGATPFSGTVGLAGDHVLWAQWTRAYTVTMRTNWDATDRWPGIVVDMADGTTAQVAYGQGYDLPVPTAVGYVFSGWYDPVANAIVDTSQPVDITSDRDFWAQWAPARTVTLMANPNGELWPGIDSSFDGGEIVKTVVVGYGQEYPEFPVPTSSGYVVSGWYDSTDGTYIPGATPFSGTVGLTGDHVLWAQWAPARTVTLMANPNGDLWPGIDSSFDGGEVAKAVVVGYGQQYPEFPVPVSSGYVVSGWYDSTDGSYTPGATPFSGTVGLTGDHVLWAQWTRAYTVTMRTNWDATDRWPNIVVDMADGTTAQVAYGQGYGLPVPTAVGYVFSGWYDPVANAMVDTSQPVDITSDRDFWAQWAPARTVTLMANPNGDLWPGIDACFAGGEVAKAVVVGYGQQYPEFPVPVSSGYVVSGWYDSTDGSYTPGATPFSGTVGLTGDHVLWAQWTANQYMVKSAANGGLQLNGRISYANIMAGNAQDIIPEVAEDADAAVVDATVDGIGFADEGVKSAIGGSASEYAAFREWARSVKCAGSTAEYAAFRGLSGRLMSAGGSAAGEAAVVANTNAAAAYLLGAERLFENAPVVEIGDVVVWERTSGTGGSGETGEAGGTAGTGGSEGTGTSISVTVTVKDGEEAVKCAAEKVKAMFEATGDLGDWAGEAKILPTVTVEEDDGSTMRFKVTPGDGTAPRAFLRIRK